MIFYISVSYFWSNMLTYNKYWEYLEYYFHKNTDINVNLPFLPTWWAKKYSKLLFTWKVQLHTLPWSLVHSIIFLIQKQYLFFWYTMFSKTFTSPRESQLIQVISKFFIDRNPLEDKKRSTVPTITTVNCTISHQKRYL